MLYVHLKLRGKKAVLAKKEESANCEALFFFFKFFIDFWCVEKDNLTETVEKKNTNLFENRLLSANYTYLFENRLLSNYDCMESMRNLCKSENTNRLNKKTCVDITIQGNSYNFGRHGSCPPTVREPKRLKKYQNFGKNPPIVMQKSNDKIYFESILDTSLLSIGKMFFVSVPVV